MTTFRPRILQCPHCESKMYTFELTSYFVHSSIVYSDGKVESNPPLLSDKKILICHFCNKEFWSDDALTEDEDIDRDELPGAKDFHDLPFAFDADFSFKLAIYFSGLLEKGFADTVNREVYLRIELWHLLNNKNRKDTDNIFEKIQKGNLEDILYKDKSSQVGAIPAENSTKLFRGNLEKLISIYNPENDNERLMLAEMHREIGDFSKALLVLHEIEYVDNKNAYKKIEKGSKRKISKVLKIN